ncbi:MAG: MOSC domain-containing protein [Gemmatimonadota bacterium]
MARIEALWIKPRHLGPTVPVDTATLRADRGVVGSANQGGKRQITIIAAETFERIREFLPDARPIMRRANVMVRGLDLEETTGRVLGLGEVRVRLRGETLPCSRMD